MSLEEITYRHGCRAVSWSSHRSGGTSFILRPPPSQPPSPKAAGETLRIVQIFTTSVSFPWRPTSLLPLTDIWCSVWASASLMSSYFCLWVTCRTVCWAQDCISKSTLYSLDNSLHDCEASSDNYKYFKEDPEDTPESWPMISQAWPIK